MVGLGRMKEILEITVMGGGVGEGALQNVCSVWCEACVAYETKHRIDHEGGLLG